MDVSKLKELIRIFEQAAITELDYEVEGVRIRLKKEQKPLATPDAAPSVRDRAVSASGLNASPPVVRAEASADQPVISAPMVGVFYRSAAPDAPPFVQPGDFIEEGQTVCIIEAMKLMNEVRSSLSGKLVEVLVESGEPVEFGQPLFVLEPVQA